MTAAPVLADFEPLDRLETNLVASWRDVSSGTFRSSLREATPGP